MDHIVEKVYRRIVESTDQDLMKLDAQIIISTNYQKSSLKMKILPPSDLKTYIETLREKINSVPGVLSFRMRPARE